MPQKIDIHGIFIDPETITELSLQRRNAVYYPVFHEEGTKSFFGRFASSQRHVLRFDHQEPYGIILLDVEQLSPSGFVVNYREAAIERFLRGVGQAGKNIAGHIQEMLKIDISGDRSYRILTPGRVVKQTSIREIPAKVRLLSGQWVDVFKSSPDYDFQGGTPYAVTDVPASALLICTANQLFLLFGGGVDVNDEEVKNAYEGLINIYNQIQAQRDASLAERKSRPLIQLPQINIQLPKVELPKIEIPQIRFQSPFVFGKKKEEPEQKKIQESNPGETES